MEGRGGSCQVLEETQTDAGKPCLGEVCKKKLQTPPSKDVFNFLWASGSSLGS